VFVTSEQGHHISKDNSYEIVVIPAGEASSTKSVKLSRTVIISGLAGIVLFIIAVTVAVLLFTPVSRFLPVSDGQISQRYGNQLLEVQQQLTGLSQEVLVLREYNRKLRLALGQETEKDSTKIDFTKVTVDQKETPPMAHSDEIGKEDVSGEISANIGRPKMFSQVSFEKEKSFQPSFPLIVPAAGYVSRKFFAEQGHLGIDFAGKVGTLIVAPADGYVVFSGWTPDDGYVMLLSHGGGYLTLYKHNQSILRAVGDFVQRGETIAMLGNTGKTSYGPHLHFEVWKDGKPKNPNDFFIASTL
jgi:murein DD-endopeptidase MepM/ murein hydrolase activator NlpD